MNPKVLIREYKASDLTQVVKVFKDAVIETGPEQYTSEQVKVWSSYPADLDEFNTILLQGLTYVAQEEDNIVSFGTLYPVDRIEFIYTIKKYSNMGIASSIYKMLENHARDHSVPKIFTEASIIAKPFFIKTGFKIEGKETVIRKNTEFQRYRMSKKLSYNQDF